MSTTHLITRQISDILNAIDTPVVKVPTWVNGYSADKIPAGYAIVDAEKEEVITTVSKGYHLVRHDEIAAPLLEKAKALGFDYFKLTASDNMASITIEAVGSSNTLSAMGEGFRPRLLFKNSYDKSASFSMAIGVYRIVCANGMVSGEGASFMRIPHTQKLFDAMPKVLQGIEDSHIHMEQYLQSFESWAHKRTDYENSLVLLYQSMYNKKEIDQITPTQKSAIDKVYALSRFGEGQSDDNTLWGVYNGLTQYYRDVTTDKPSLAKEQRAQNAIVRFQTLASAGVA